jgi:hypothetical protein
MTVKINGQPLQEVELELLKQALKEYAERGKRLMCHSVSIPLFSGACPYCTFQGLNCARLVNLRENIK